MKRLITICAAAMMVFTISVAYALPSDDFNDDSMNTTLWTLYEDDHNNAWLDETGGRLEMRSTADAADDFAIYLANNWVLLPTDDFSLRIDFRHFRPYGDSSSGVMLGIAKDYNNIALFGADCNDTGSYFSYEVELDGIEDDEGSEVRYTNMETLYISYNATDDELYLSNTSYDSNDALFTISDLLQGEWGGAAVAPFLGGFSEDMALASGDVYLDNFVVDSGTYIPEPATIALFGLGALALRSPRRRREQ